MMRKTWVFFKLRMLQLKYDKTAVLFCYIFPVLMLLGLGYMKEGNDTISVYYQSAAGDEAGQRFIDRLSARPLLELKPLRDRAKGIDELLRTNAIKHFLMLNKTNNDSVAYTIFHSSSAENAVENMAVDGIVREVLNGSTSEGLDSRQIETGNNQQGLQVLLPGLIGMTLLIVGLNGFGHVLIQEKHRGLFKNIKTISVSPAPFLTGLFLSRLLISYSVVALLFLIAVYVFDVSPVVNYGLLLLIVTLGAIAFLGLGLMLATISPSVQAFTGIVNFVQLPFIVLGGVFFSITAFPEWLQSLAQVIPLTGMNLAMQKIIFSASEMGVAQIGDELVVLGVWCAVTLVISYRKFTW